MTRKTASLAKANPIRTGSIVIYNEQKHKVAYYNRILSPNDVFIFKHHKRGPIRWTSIEKVKLSDVTLWVPELS